MEYHEQTRVTLRSVALELGMAEQNYGAWLNGKRGLPYSKVDIILRILSDAGYLKFRI